MFKNMIRSARSLLLPILGGRKPSIRRNHDWRRHRRLSMQLLENRQMLAIVVDIQVDEFDNSITNGDISLRDAIDKAVTGELITFAPSLNGATIALDRNLGELAFSKSLTIDASNLSSRITIDAGTPLGDPTPNQKLGDGMRIFKIVASPSPLDRPSVTLRGLTLRGGDVSGNGGAISVNDGLSPFDYVV